MEINSMRGCTFHYELLLITTDQRETAFAGELLDAPECCATIKNRPLATISHTPHGRASSPKGSTVKPAAAGGGGQIGQALRAISSVSIID